MDEAFTFVENSSGPRGYSAVFEATPGDQEGTPAGGYLYVWDSINEAILRNLEIYSHSAHEVKESDIQVFWSTDLTKCGVAIWGRMRGVIEITSSREIVAPLNNPASPAITDDKWLEGFEGYLDREQFIKTRQQFWKEKANEQKGQIGSVAKSETPIETNFVVYAKGMNRLFSVFEDDGETGYLYVVDADERRILQQLQIYDDARQLGVSPEDVRVVWNDASTKCGVLVWDKMRGIIDLPGKREGRVKLDSRETPGIGDSDWLSGFQEDDKSAKGGTSPDSQV